MGWSVLRDRVSKIKLMVVVPEYIMALGPSWTVLGVGPGIDIVKSRALDAAAGEQLAAAVMTLS